MQVMWQRTPGVCPTPNLTAPFTLMLLPDDQVIVRRAGQRLRVCIEYMSTTRVLLWLELGHDGSLYTNWSEANPLDQRTFVPRNQPNGSTAIAWDDSHPIDASMFRPKITFHASGVILSPLGRSIGVNLRLLTERSLICVYLPKHPRHWRKIEQARRRDIVIRNLLADEFPFSIELYYEPAGRLPALESNPKRGVFVVPVGFTQVRFTEVRKNERVLMHLLFHHRLNTSAWPPHSTIAWPVLRDRTAPSELEQWVEPGLQ